jgi:hypothetical protein
MALSDWINEMTELNKISYEEWRTTYKPLDNEFNPDVPGGQLFLIPCSVEEMAYLQNVEASRIWTYGCGEYGGTYIWSGESGQGTENLGAYVTEISYQGVAIIEVELSEPEYTCPQCEMGYTGELAIKQRQDFEDACEDCGTILSCTICNTEVGRDENCPNGCDETIWT